MFRRLSHLTSGRVLCVIAALLAVGYVTVAVAHGPSERTPLVGIRRVGPALSQSAYWLNRTFRHSQTVATYQDLGGVNGMSWQFWIRYRGCPATPRGALRLTLYRAPLSADAHSAVAAAKQKRLYSRTLVEHESSGNSTYEFPGSQETYFFIRVQVPSRAGCAEWKYGATTN